MSAQALDIDFIPNDPTQALAKIGTISRIIGATLRNTVNPSVLRAGYKVNVVPQTATAEIDGRFLPGYEQEFFDELDRVLGPGVTREFILTDIALETTPDGDLYDAMTSALLAEDPAARVIPYCLLAGTDAKSFSRLGIRCFGFTPFRLPPDLDFSGMFHGVDERVPRRRIAVRGPCPRRVPGPLLAPEAKVTARSRSAPSTSPHFVMLISRPARVGGL